MKLILFLLLVIYVLPTTVTASSSYFPEYEPPRYEHKLTPPKLQPPNLGKIHWEKPGDPSSKSGQTGSGNADPQKVKDDGKSTSFWKSLLEWITKPGGVEVTPEAILGASVLGGTLYILGMLAARGSAGLSAGGNLSQIFRTGGLITSGGALTGGLVTRGRALTRGATTIGRVLSPGLLISGALARGRTKQWSRHKGKLAGVSLALLVLSGGGAYLHNQTEGYDAAVAKERQLQHILSKMEDSAAYIKMKYGDQLRGFYRDEKGILRDANGGVAWDFIAQYRERKPALYEQLVYPTLEHGERVIYWGKKVLEWADAHNMVIADVKEEWISFVPEELRKEAIENAYLHNGVKSAYEAADVPNLG